MIPIDFYKCAMIEITQVAKLKGDLVVIIPPEFAESIGINEGDEVRLFLMEKGVMVSLSDSELTQTMRDAHEFMQSHRQAFQRLGK